MNSPQQVQLFVPDRFDMLQRRASKLLNNIIVPVDAGLRRIKKIHQEMTAAGRGGFLLLRGDSGSGKSTFVNTLGLFLNDVEVVALPRQQDIEQALRTAKPTSAALRVIIVEGRDALRDVSAQVLESAIHEINSFIRSESGEGTLVVWPVNADDLEHSLIETSQRVGADSLLGVEEPTFRFSGPPNEQYVEIASRTVATLNQGASLADLGVAMQDATELAREAPTVGSFMGLIRKALLQNENYLNGLPEKERCRLWIVAIASNDLEGDVSGLTRGTLSSMDTERLLGATNANIVQELKRFPERLGILGAVLDGKILHLPSVMALAIAREFAESRLSAAMTSRGLSLAGKRDAVERLSDSDLARAFSGLSKGTRTRGPKPGPNTEEAFRKLADIATSNDTLLNGAVGAALKAANLITKFETERDLGTGLKRRTDILCEAAGLGVVRLEVMWRGQTGRADIANYTLTKLYNYGRAIGFLDDPSNDAT